MLPLPGLGLAQNTLAPSDYGISVAGALVRIRPTTSLTETILLGRQEDHYA